MGAASDHAAPESRDLGRTQPMGSTTPATSRTPIGDPAASPKLSQPGILERLLERGRRFGAPGPRYQVDGMLGVGGGGRVFAVSDRNLDRGVAMKVISIAGDDSGARHVLDEARIAASLSHPNVLPVYELDLTDEGEIYYTMKRIEGRALSAAMDQAGTAGEARPPSVNELTRIFLGVAQALAYAHHRGIVHQDVKPDNIMLGEFGEVLLVDWGSAARLGDGAARVYGTPLYMSPEQARVESIDPRSDVYCLGATMFHALLGRIPTWADTPEAFWERKRRGEIDAPSIAERRRAPPALLAIALKALAPRPADRYQRAEEVVQDLDRFQAGLAVSAYAEPPLARLARWHRRHWRRLWTTVAVATVIVSLGAALYGEKLKELTHWGRPQLLAFDADWQRRWIVYRGAVERQGERLVTTGKDETLLLYEKPFSGAIAVEYDAEYTGDRPGDISLEWWRPDYDRIQAAKGSGQSTMKGGYRLLVGAWDGSACQIETEDGAVSFAYFKPVLHHRYRIRGEIEGDRLALFVDGKRVCDYRTNRPISRGYLVLRGYYPGQAFSGLRVYTRGMPERMPPTGIGDWLVEQGRLDEAAAAYQCVAQDHAGEPIGDEARYRRGLCDFWQGRYAEAAVVWKPLAGDPRYAQLLRLHRLDELHAQDSPALLGEMERLYRDGSADIRHRIALQWMRDVQSLMRGAPDTHIAERAIRERLEPLVALHDRCFPDEAITDKATARALIVCGRLEEETRRYPQLQYETAGAFMMLGRPDIVLQRYSWNPFWGGALLLMTGRYDELERRFGGDAWVLFKQARFSEIARKFPKTNNAIAAGLLAQGRLDEALAADPGDEKLRARVYGMLGRSAELKPSPVLGVQVEILMSLRRGEEALARCGPDEPDRRWPLALLGLQAWIRGDRAEAERRLAPSPWPEGYQHWEYVWLLRPFLHGLDGDWAGLDASCRGIIKDFRYFDDQLDYHQAAYLLGRIDDADFLAQPFKAFAQATLHRIKGMRAERLGHRGEALAEYRAYLATPLWQRYQIVDPVWDLFVEWRAAQLEAGSLPPPRTP